MTMYKTSWIEGWRIPAGLAILAVIGLAASAIAWRLDPRQLPTLLGGMLTYIATLVVGLITWAYVRTTERTLQITVHHLTAKPAVDVTFDGSDYDYLNDTFDTNEGDKLVRLRLRVTLINNGRAAGFVAVREPRSLTSVAAFVSAGFEVDAKTSVGSLRVEVNEIRPAVAVVLYRSHRGIPLDTLQFIAGEPGPWQVSSAIRSRDKGR